MKTDTGAVINGIDRVRTPRETARLLGGMSTKTLWRMELRGDIRPTRLTERIKGFRDSEINRVIAERTK
jgi:predicted DNA-binding transcriptional regulator AlpA